jgi:GNAT superfamily N-acetyltransferase
VEIRYRTFRNTDPPHLVDIWRSQPPERALMQPASVALFDMLLFAKQYFDPAGLVLAFDGEVPVGFGHAAFGSTDDGRRIDRTLGVTHLVMVRPHYQGRGIGSQLLIRCEEYLRREGAQVLYAGGVGHLNGFYLGMYGGSELPGVLDSSVYAQKLFLKNDYREIDRVHVLHRDLMTFRPPIDRRLMPLRRNATMRFDYDPPSPNWWHASTYGCFNLVRYALMLKVPTQSTPIEAAAATFWMMETFTRSWGVHAAGLIDVQTRPELQRQGIATFLLGEAFHHLRSEGTTLVETQTMVHNAAALGLYKKLGFTPADQGAVYRKA